ncbi:c-type cytochrome [Mucilaginibacter arboris]|uniref:C-type cytochrome n=1 Tax=Mucilaginibacter arboris TaxID=2682090 RepID=A0A7K1SU67_9SPHI|nr:cytochrome c [Mucilaginibacter arboris]MVN20798.1 c-type cytochrome [Mucilaginibacter arboris]
MKRLIVLLLPFTFILTTIFVSCQSESEIEYKRYYIQGRNIYQTQCKNCHAENGEGLGGLIPPLQAADYLKKNKGQLACIIQNGLKGAIQVNGKTYNGQMPAQTQLSPIEIAEVITYISNSFGNKQGIYQVEKVNVDLGNCR